MLLIAELVAALVGLYYLITRNIGYWKYFSFYLVFIALQESFWHFGFGIDPNVKQNYYAYFGIPVQYLFLYWLYAFNSLQMPKLFWSCVGLYLLSYIPIELWLKKLNVLYALNLTIGTVILMGLALLEFLKQIRDDSILNFRQNKMFYINAGVVLFYVGTYPLFCFYEQLRTRYQSIWNYYFLYFLLANISMYLLFTFSFLWGTRGSK
ncbi:hypothetical protein [Aquimarina brevivitae]|nr:hypothetical protein [Aquimarina brevivitae]